MKTEGKVIKKKDRKKLSKKDSIIEKFREKKK